MLQSGSWFVMAGILVLGACSGTPEYVPPGRPVPVRFVSTITENEQPSTVTVRNERQTASCTAPCRVDFPSGSADVSVSGLRQYTSRVIIPPSPAVGTLRKHRTGQVIAGSVIGLLFGLAGIGASAAGKVYDDRKDYDKSIISYGTSAGLFGVAIIGSIVAMTAGKDRVTVEAEQSVRLRDASSSAEAQRLAAADSVLPLPILAK